MSHIRAEGLQSALRSERVNAQDAPASTGDDEARGKANHARGSNKAKKRVNIRSRSLSNVPEASKRDPRGDAGAGASKRNAMRELPVWPANMPVVVSGQTCTQHAPRRPRLLRRNVGVPRQKVCEFDRRREHLLPVASSDEIVGVH